MNRSYWPDDPTGDVLRDLEAGGFDFDAEYTIDFSVDFDAWPPSKAFIKKLKAIYPSAEIHAPEGDNPGDVRFVIEAKLSYERVTSILESVSALAEPYGGWCESWGVVHEQQSD